MSKKYEEALLHHIYAIIEPNVEVVYVGKTTIKNPHKKHREVINGKISSIDGEFSERCKFFLLESIYISKADAFRHILAWYRFFEENGFDVLASKEATFMLEFPKEKTEKIYSEICLPYSLKEVLERKVLPLEAAEEKEDLQTEQSPFTQLNIRVRENVANSFRSVSRKFGLSQNDTLKLLMTEKDDSMKRSLAEEICDLKRENHNYKEMLKQQRKQYREDKNRAVERYKELVEISNNAINLFVNFLEDISKEEIKQQKFKESKKLFHLHSYPETSGCCLATLEEIVIGKYHESQLGTVTTTKFLLFKTLNGEKIKLRLFGKNNFVGRYPITYAHKSSLWIVGYIISNDGGANMILAIPVDSIYKKSLKDENTVLEEEKFSSLEDLISSAEDFRGNI